jgi:hypothetical protein
MQDIILHYENPVEEEPTMCGYCPFPPPVFLCFIISVICMSLSVSTLRAFQRIVLIVIKYFLKHPLHVSGSD